MTNLGKYRKLSYIAIAVMVVTMLLSFAALWNSLLTSDAKNEGWVILFFLLAFLSGVFLFFLAYKSTDAPELENIKKTSFEAGKKEILQEIEKRNQEVEKEKIEEEDIDKSTEGILAGLKGIRTETGLCNKVLTNLANQLGFVQGIFYVKETGGELFNAAGDYALTGMKPKSFKAGENLPGQVAVHKAPVTVYDIPEEYFSISSGLGSSKPRFLILAPVLFKEECVAVLELASFKKPDELTIKVLNKISSELGIRLNKFAVAS
ncbi:MAG: GAF domain-containing protein [Bacteroidales bacterium]|nr:GAF domain-containing protein [Bacteroidales bacterium]